MVEVRAIERFGGAREAPCGAAVAVAWTRVAARMIVREHDAPAAVLAGVGDDLAQREARPRFVTLMARDVDAASPLIHMRDPQGFAPGIESSPRRSRGPR